MIKTYIVYTLLLLFAVQTSYGQTPENIPNETVAYIAAKPEMIDSINSIVWDTRQDRNGNIWFAADDGVYRYDGKSFTKITETLNAKHFFSVFEDSKGNFWFGTSGSGVYYYNGKSFQHFTTKEGLVSNLVMPIYEDKAGSIWIGTAGGVSRYDGKSFQNFTTAEGLANNNVHDIVQDKKGRIWFGTQGKISIYNGQTFTSPIDKEGKAFWNVWAMIKDKKGNIWFGAERGPKLSLWRYDGNSFVQIDQTGAGVIIEDKKGNILTTLGGPIFRFDEKSLSDKIPHVATIETESEGRRNLPFGLLAANDGNIWIGPDRYKYDGKTLTRVNNLTGR